MHAFSIKVFVKIMSTVYTSSVFFMPVHEDCSCFLSYQHVSMLMVFIACYVQIPIVLFFPLTVLISVLKQ